jgi:hypothetical protein
VRELRSGKVVLAPSLQRALAQRFPDFRRVGNYVTGDFDGNRRTDVALYLTNRRPGVPDRQCAWLFVAFHQTAKGTFQPYLLARRRDPSTTPDPYKARPSRFEDYGMFDLGGGSIFPYHVSGGRERQMELRHDGIVENHEDQVVWFFEGGRYHKVRVVGDLNE